jgi:hypothetical protein
MSNSRVQNGKTSTTSTSGSSPSVAEKRTVADSSPYVPMCQNVRNANGREERARDC